MEDKAIAISLVDPEGRRSKVRSWATNQGNLMADACIGRRAS